MTQMDLFQTQTQDEQSSQRATLANHFHLPGSAEALKMTDISGRTFFPLFKPNNPLGAFSKMCLGTSLWASTKCYLTWKVKPITQSKHFILEPFPSMPRTEECASSSSPEMWPTPTVQDSNKATKKWRDDHQNNLTAAVFNPEKMWPTPSASNAKGAVRDRFYGSEKYRHNLDEAVRTHKYDGQLNPTFVEYLMGFPIGWTDLED